MIIVGSFALEYHGISRKTPKDIDIWITPLESLPSYKVDSYIVSQEIYDLVPRSNGYATPDAIFTIKCSHFAYDIHWQKTKKDILWLKAKGCKIIPKLYAALKLLWAKDYGNKSFLSLTKKKDEFFNDFVDYKYDHDYLHELVAHPHPPMYSKCHKEGHEVLIDKNKFFAMPKHDQLQMFREEITVIAIERWIIDGKHSWYSAYNLALKKVITRLTKNWATDFIIANIDYYCVPNYSLFKNALKILQLQDTSMNKVQQLVADLYHAAGKPRSLDYFVFKLAEGHIEVSNEIKVDSAEETQRSAQDLIKEFNYELLQHEEPDDGDEGVCFSVFRLKDKIMKVEFTYYSHDGYNYDDVLYTLREVKPKTATVTVYE